MTELTRLLIQAARYAADYRDGLADREPRPTITAEALQARFDGPLPEAGEGAGRVIEALNSAAIPGLAGTAGRRFFGWVIGGSHPVGVAADMLTSAWGQNAGSYAASPAAAMAEKVAARWLLDLLQLPAGSSVGFVTGATMANFVGLAAARHRVLARVGWDVETDGMQGAPRVRLLLGADAHTTVLAALRYLGFGSDVMRIATDDQGRMQPEALAAALAAGSGPAIVIAQAGQINTGAFDPFAPIAELCRAHGAWLHIDGAFGLWARVLPEMAAMCAGIELADSWCTDGHKWLQLPYDSGFAIVRDSDAHQRAMSITASYLPTIAGAEYDPGPFVPELSRRARGFAAWAVIRALGREGIVAMVRRHCALARRVAALLAAEPGVQVLNDVCLNQIIVQFGAGTPEQRDALTRATIEQLQKDNIVLAGGTDWHGRWALRLSVISNELDEADIDRLVNAILSARARSSVG